MPIRDGALGRDHRCGRCGAEFPLVGEFGRYRVVRKLGRGGMSDVYQATDTRVYSRQVALKVPRFDDARDPDEWRRRFLREARALAGLDHPNICPIHEVGEVDGDLFMAMKSIDGRTLDACLRDEGPRAPRQAAGLVRTIALAMAEAHERGVVHRDLKPSNIMIDRHDQPVIIDFGLALEFEEDGSRDTVSGTVLGTVDYMPPEQVRGDRGSVGPRSDVYSLGVVLYELLTGRRPFEAPTPLATFDRVLREEPAKPSVGRPEVGPELEAICLKAMAKAIEGRHPDMAAFARALGEYLGGADRPSVAAAPAPRRPGPARDSGAATTIIHPGPATVVANAIGMKIALIPPGEFLMGSADSDREANDDERPRHRVRITRPYCLGIHAVTQEQYRAVTDLSPSRFGDRPLHPVERVSWYDAVSFCNLLSEREQLRPYYRIEHRLVTVLGGEGYRLPTEAEWEYACRAGGGTRYHFGDDPASLGRFAWYFENSGGATHAVGEKEPNRFGLFDMHGNVWEWCWGGYQADYYRGSPPADPPGVAHAPNRVMRGGGWCDVPRRVRSAFRGRNAPESRSDDLGFRVARSPSGG